MKLLCYGVRPVEKPFFESLNENMAMNLFNRKNAR